MGNGQHGFLAKRGGSKQTLATRGGSKRTLATRGGSKTDTDKMGWVKTDTGEGTRQALELCGVHSSQTLHSHAVLTLSGSANTLRLS